MRGLLVRLEIISKGWITYQKANLYLIRSNPYKEEISLLRKRKGEHGGRKGGRLHGRASPDLKVKKVGWPKGWGEEERIPHDLQICRTRIKYQELLQPLLTAVYHPSINKNKKCSYQNRLIVDPERKKLSIWKFEFVLVEVFVKIQNDEICPSSPKKTPSGLRPYLV